MSLEEYKITDGHIAQKGVVAAPDRLTGTAAQNKAIFDRLIREAVKSVFNGLIDALSNGGAGEIGVEAIEGVTGDNVQTILESLKILLDGKEGAAEAAAALLLKADKTETAQHIKSVSFNAQNGVFTFTKQNGQTVTIDTMLEKLAVNFQYDATTQELVLTLADGTTQRISLSAFITETEFVDSDQIDFSVSSHKVTATIKQGSITDAMLSSGLVTMLQGYVSSAAGSATNASTSAAAAAGSASAASGSAGAAAASAAAAAASETAAASSASSAAASAQAAATSETNAGNSATEAAGSATNAQSWAVGGTGTRSGEDTNNSRYWCEQAQQAAGGGVTSFNGRSGIVTPKSGDYTAEQVGAIPSSEKGTAGGVASLGADGKVPTAQLPSMDYIPTAQKGAADGVASLGADGKVPSSQLPPAGVKSYYKRFSASDWNNEEIVIPAATHGLSASAVIAQFSALVSGVYYPDTWSARESYASVDAQTGAITLHSERAYAGVVLLIG